MLQRFIRHDWAEIGPADADIDDVADAFAGLAFPAPCADAVGKIGHSVENGVHIGDYVTAVVEDSAAAGRAQRDMEDGAVLRDIDLVAAEHGVDLIAQCRLASEPQQERQRLVSNPVFGIVEVESCGFDR